MVAGLKWVTNNVLVGDNWTCDCCVARIWMSNEVLEEIALLLREVVGISNPRKVRVILSMKIALG